MVWISKWKFNQAWKSIGLFPLYFWNETMNFWGGGWFWIPKSFFWPFCYQTYCVRVCVTPVVLKCFDMSGHGIYNHPTVWTILVLPLSNVHSPCLCFIFPECKCKSCDMPESICCPSSRPLWHPPRFPRTCVGVWHGSRMLPDAAIKSRSDRIKSYQRLW